MFSSTRTYFAVILAILLLGAPWVAINYPDKVQEFASFFENAAWQVAAVIVHNPRTIAELKAKYASTSFDINNESQAVTVAAGTTVPSYASGALAQNTKNINDEVASIDISTTTETKVKILIAPGHEPGYGGAEYGSLKERMMNTELSRELFNILKDDPHFEVYITRNNEVWDPIFAKYFKDSWSDIVKWQKESHKEMKHLISIGSTTVSTPKVYHNTAPTNVAMRLYGITKWANDNIIDVVIHVHFNDYPEHRDGVPGIHKGFSIYVPAGQFSNSTTTKAIAAAVFKRLAKNNAISTLPGESSGIVDEGELIAIGANNTADAASMLIEYGYIYEPQFSTAEKRKITFKNLAYDTYLGLLDFFTSDSGVTPGYF
jgi:N-acetylmuramoyl-L-alanine amidase